MRNWKLWEHPERKANKILKMGSRGLQQAAAQAVGAEEKRGEAVQTVRRTDWL